MPARTLVAYFSKGGATSRYAQVVAETLAARGFPVDRVDLHVERAPKLDDYANVVIGTGVRIGVVYRMGKRILRRQELKGKRLAVFLASGIAVHDPERARNNFLTPLFKRFGLQPMSFVALPGMLPGGDHGELVDNTQPDEARRWADGLAEQLLAAEASDGRLRKH